MTQRNVGELQKWVPHRPPAVWVDRVQWSEGNEGECRVVLDPGAAYASNGKVRPSSYIEWIAQAYGFTQASELASREPGPLPDRVFLAAIKNFALVRELGSIETLRGRELSVRVKKTHQIGPVALVQGTVEDWDGELLARAELKLFAG